MESETLWVIVVAGFLILAPLYGYWMGTVAKRRSWNARKLVQVLLKTLFPPVIGVMLMLHASDIHGPPIWVGFAVGFAVFLAVWSCIVLTASIAAAKSSGIPMRTLLWGEKRAKG